MLPKSPDGGPVGGFYPNMDGLSPPVGGGTTTDGLATIPEKALLGYDYEGAGALFPPPNNYFSSDALFKNGLFLTESFLRNGFARTSETGYIGF